MKRITASKIILLLGIGGSFGVMPMDRARADWPHFRGPTLDGISRETGFRTTHTEPLKLVWERNVGSAFSSFAVVDDRLYTCGMGDKQQILYSLNADTGEIIWQKPFEKEYRESHGDGTRSTPTVHDGRVYILGAHGRLLCVNADNGETIWEKSFKHPPQWGYSSSVLIEGDWAISSGGKEHGALAAYDRKTGKEIWKTGTDEAGYAMPYPFTFEGKRYIVGFVAQHAIIVEAATGREVWRTPWQTDWNVNAAMPIFHNGHLYLSSGYKTGSGLYRLSASGDDLKGEEVWRSKVLLNKFQTPILHEGHLYGSDQRAFKCVDFMTGAERWMQPRVANATAVLADGHLIVLTEGGQLRIGKADPAGFEPTTEADILSGRCWSAPVLHKGRVYARNLERIVTFDLR